MYNLVDGMTESFSRSLPVQVGSYLGSAGDSDIHGWRTSRKDSLYGYSLTVLRPIPLSSTIDPSSRPASYSHLLIAEMPRN